ncbi:hypothetical protein [Undibacterium sp.]|jgi:hypothetical protein|uniref:hypothetical protein n=1 Tax=Undibacterium sp. TaxID=1914977 RepID=UPI002C044AA0|nr:hypothetical protein [Undibacterium sp.]HTD06810.1 hypothetical protein [Undibacterium sp.]
MKTFTLALTETVSAITCDCCQTNFSKNDLAWYEIQSIEFTAGYGSIFGDGKTISIDLCQDFLIRKMGE